jgi:hypothetical protein
MRLLVSNPSILVLLEQEWFLLAIAKLPIELSVTDLLYERELKSCNGQKLVQLGLQIQILDPSTTTLAASYQQRNSTVCLTESFALALAKASNFTLLSINPDLTRLAQAEEVDYCNLCWLFNYIVDEKAIALEYMLQGLVAISQKVRCYLLRKELNDWLSIAKLPMIN